MPKRTDLESILIIGAGPISIGQACEFDYSGTQACKALREEGYRIILVNSNPATIMTDPEIADATYIEPVNWKIVQKIIEKERPNAVLPTMGGQTALNCVRELDNQGILKAFSVNMIGTTAIGIEKSENRYFFDKTMKKIGLNTARSNTVRTLKEALEVIEEFGFPCVIRSSFSMGGSGSGIAYNYREFKEICTTAFNSLLVTELLIDEFLTGWKEYEMEVIQDINGNCMIVCSIENFDPMGIHTGDSITVTPAQTLTDKEFQIMRNASISILREIGYETSSANVQFSINPNTGRLIVIEMNPRVSRSSALASKATGFPIAKIASKLAIGYTLDELINDIAGGCTPVFFEPSIDYVVTKVPRFNFEKFLGVNNRLTTQMKSVGEVMGIGRTFQESIQKALRGLETGVTGLDPKIYSDDSNVLDEISIELENPGSERIWYIADAFRFGMSVEKVFQMTKIDPWFLVQIEELVFLETKVIKGGIKELKMDFLRFLKRKGFSDSRLAKLVCVSEFEIRKLRLQYGLHPVYKRVDTCAAEFSTDTAYMYSTYEEECESNPNKNCKKIMVLGGGPNRIGQGIEFDYCCVHAMLALREDGYETVMVNCNPETTSTDYDISDRLYFEALTLEDVLEVIRVEQPDGVIVHFGGQTPLQLAIGLKEAGVNLLGTSPDSIDRTENRERFKRVIDYLNLKQPPNASVYSLSEALEEVENIGYPLLVRPSYVLGGRAMQIIYNESDLKKYFQTLIFVSNDAPVLLDKFLDNAIEVDIDAVCDGNIVLIAGIMEHIEQAGVHSGDSGCSLPPYTLNKEIQNVMRKQVKRLAFELKVHGLINVQFAVKNDEVYLIEVNLRAARTVPFVSKAIGIPFAKVAARVIAGTSLFEQGLTKEIIPSYFSVKEVALPFNKFQGIDPVLGPEMRSTGEVMGIGSTFPEAFSKAILGIQSNLEKGGRVLLCIREKDKKRIVDLAVKLSKFGFQLDATSDTADVLNKAFVNVCSIENDFGINVKKTEIQFKKIKYTYVVSAISDFQSIENFKIIRCSALQNKIYFNSTLNASFATILSLNINPTEKVTSIQTMHAKIKSKL